MKKIQELKFPNQVVACIEGQDGTRKTSFTLLTPPEPIGYFNLDRGLPRVPPAVRDRDIEVGLYSFRKATEDAAEAAQRLWPTISRDIHDSIDENKTTVIDTFNLLYDCVRLALLEKLEKVKSRYYGEVNRQMNDIFDHAYDSGNHLIVVCPVTKEYRGEEATGNMVPAGWGDVIYRVNQRMVMQEDDGVFTGTILKPRGMQGKVITDPDWVSFATTVFPGTDEDEWS